MATSRRRAASPYWDGQTNGARDRSSSRGKSDFSRSLRALIEKVSGSQPDPTNPVVNGASAAVEKPWLRGLLAELATQLPRVKADVGLIASLANTKIFDGGLVDDKAYQMEKIIQLAASLPTDSRAQSDLSQAMIGILWDNLQHPPLSLQDPTYKYRMADGSNNNLMYPNLGKAGSSYARTVTPKTLLPGDLPDPGVIFDAIYARDEKPREHPNNISSMLLYLASIIIHDVFYTDPRDPTKVKTSSYLDLAPLYGSSVEEQARVRTFRDGLLKPDTFSESRILGFPPGVAALLICFNRYHNFVAIQMKLINEGGRFTPPADSKNERALKKLDEDLFQTARLVTCGLYVNIILIDYVRTILNLNRIDSTWTLDPRDDSAFFDAKGVPQGIGNQVSMEFNLVYRWHSATSKKDAQWTEDAYGQIFPGRKISDIEETEFIMGLRKWLANLDSDPSKWALDFGRYQRNKRGAFKDSDLSHILTEATEDPICAFGPRQVPVAMKILETLGIKQARDWKVATLNEFRKTFALQPYQHFSELSSDPDIQRALKGLYKHIDYVELYPGLVAEDAKESMTPGSGICLGYTTSRTILSDAVALVRGDRFYTVDFTPATMTNWGFNQIKSDPEVAQGHCIYNLIMRAMPGYYRGRSIYAMFPFVTPKENFNILQNLGTEKDYIFDRPSRLPNPVPIRTWHKVTEILADVETFRVPWGEHIKQMTGRNYMLGSDSARSAADHKDVYRAIYGPPRGMEEIQHFYESITRQLIVIGQERLRDDWFQLDVCEDVAQPSHSVFVAKLWNIPLKTKGDPSLGIEVDKMYLAMSLMFAYVFLDGDTTRSFRLRKAAKQATDELSKLLKLICEAIETGEKLRVSKLFDMLEDGQMLESYGQKLIQRMFDNGWDADTVVANLLPTAAAATATQAQTITQIIEFYLSEPYKQHWPNIVKLARSDSPEAFELLKSYALEACRLRPTAYGLIRRAAAATQVRDGDHVYDLQKGDTVYVDFTAAGTDEKKFPDPYEVKLDRPRISYIHQGWGMHECIGRTIVEIAMAAQLKVFAQLKNLRKAPGPQGEIKFIYPPPNPVSSNPVPLPGKIKAFFKEDWSDFWPFPTNFKVQHDGFDSTYEEALINALSEQTGLPDAQTLIIERSRERSLSRSPSPSHSHSHHHHHHQSNSRSQDEDSSPRRSRSGCPHGARTDDTESEEMDEEDEEDERSPPRRRMNTLDNDLAYGDEDSGGRDDREIDVSGLVNGGDAPRRMPNGYGRSDGSHLHPRSALR